MRTVPLVSTLRRASPRKRLWLGGSALAMFLLTLLLGNGLIRPARAVTRANLGHDFLAFYTAARFVRDGRYHDLYDLDAVRTAEQATAHANGVDLGTAFGPWWNPPFYALALEPLARLPYGRALDVWRWINVAAAAAAAVLLGRIIVIAIPFSGPEGRAFPRGQREETRPSGPPLNGCPKTGTIVHANPPFGPGRTRPGLVSDRPKPFVGEKRALMPHANPGRVRPGLNGVLGFTTPSVCGQRLNGIASAGLVPLLLLTSMPFVQAMSHGQNTCTSLLLLTATVALWRAGRPVWAGIVGGLLFYKPQLAAVVAGVMVVDLGWAAVAGLATTGVTLLAVTTVALPGSLADWLHRLPANVHFMQVEQPYMWDRHVTLKAFWRLLLQGTAAGAAKPLTTVLTDVSVAALAAALAWTAVRARGTPGRRDRLIAATVCAMPLLMPFYFDYDLLLLAVPLTLYAADRQRDRWLSVGWVLLYAELFVNAAVASRTHVGGAAVLLAGVTVASFRRVNQADAAADPIPLSTPNPLAAAA